MSLILTTAIEKGGTGKTTTVVNLAALMAAEGKRVLVVDMDQQANTTYMLTQHKKAENFYKGHGPGEYVHELRSGRGWIWLPTSTPPT